MSKKKDNKAKPKEQTNANHKEDFLSVLSKAVQPKKQRAIK
jgi:hypothetical protein